VSTIQSMEAEVRAVDARAAAFVRRMHDAHGMSKTVMALFTAMLAGDAAIVNSFTKYKHELGNDDEMEEIVEEARVRLAKAELCRLNVLREELEALVKLVVPEAHVTFNFGGHASRNIEEVLTWAQLEA